MQRRSVSALLLFVALALGQNSILTAPKALLTATGLATAWTNNLNQTIAVNAAFIQGAWIDTATNNVFAYNPLVITTGTTPAIAPTPPNLPASAVVGLWFGYNGNTLTLADQTNGVDLQTAACVNGMPNSIFGQFAYCNAVNFFNSINNAINSGALKVPPLGTANDGNACPTTRDFFVIDMDQSDNVVTSYLVTATNLIAQGTISNANKLGATVVNTLTNASDIRLVEIAMDTALGCTPWQIQDMSETTATNFVATFPTAEIQAGVWQQAPIALVPISHAMTRLNNQPSLQKTNLYRVGCNQVQATTLSAADGTVYCQNLYFNGPKRLAANAQGFSNFGSPDPNAATNLFAFLVQRMFTSFGPDGLNCASLLNVVNPIVPTVNMNNVFVGGTINVPNPNAGSTGLGTTNIIIIVVCTVVGGLLIIGLIAGVVWYRNRSMYS
jgi:hypothetical protein